MSRSNFARLAATGLATTLCASMAQAQFNNQWLTVQQDNSVLPSAWVNDTQEKDFDWGDVDNDGDIDLVMVRKEPFTSAGRRANVLFMNEGGTLVDRTGQYATASDVSGDNGFNTNTNDRDVKLGDFDGDGFLDIVTAVTLSCGQPKHVSHPRIYMNLGNDGSGNWLGFRYEDARFPQLVDEPKFCAVAVGDVTGDGAPDLYFANYIQGNACAAPPYDDKLFVNNGNGFFTDESNSRMTNEMLDSAFGMACEMVDLNLDGTLDIIKDTGLDSPTEIRASYNNPGNEGFFNVVDHFHNTFTPYHVSAGDLNNDGRPDIITADDASDRFRFNTGTDSFGRATWSSARTFSFLSGSDDGFGGNTLIVDLDLDGWNDGIVTDVDVDIPGCNRRMHIYHNHGGAVGSTNLTMREERQSSGGGWIGAVGMTSSGQTGTHDIAAADFDGDGDLDLVLGRCTGMSYYENKTIDGPPATVNYCTSSPNSVGSGSVMGSTGTTSIAANDLTLTASGSIPNQFAIFYYGPNQVSAAFGNGIRCVGGQTVRFPVMSLSPAGNASMALNNTGTHAMAGPIVSGSTFNFQLWYRDPADGAPGFNLSDGLSVTFQP